MPPLWTPAAKPGGMPNAADPLFSQGAVALSGDLLFTVNAGSNSLSMFKIHEHDATRLTLVGQPQSTLGQFPISVAYAPR